MSGPDNQSNDVQVGMPIGQVVGQQARLDCGPATTPAQQAALRTSLEQSGVKIENEPKGMSVMFCQMSYGQPAPQAGPAAAAPAPVAPAPAALQPSP